ncbi:Pentatricopeptide repeat-containing protein At4g02750 [Linum perenne]
MISGYAQNGKSLEALRVYGQMRNTNLTPDCGAFDMYSKTGSIADAGKLFDEMPERNIVTWNAYISNAVLDGRPKGALQAFKSCVDADVYVGSALVDMYGKCGSIHDAEQTFREMPEKNLFAWNAMISGYAHQGHAGPAELILRLAPSRSVVTWTSLISGCVQNGHFSSALRLFSNMRREDILPSSALVDMYGNCGSIHDAEQTFREMPEKNLFAWNAMISGYSKTGSIADAGKLFDEMPERNIVTWNAYIYMYGKCESIHDAEQTFREMPEKNLFAWNAMISGYSKTGSIADAGKLFDEMPERNIVTWNAYISNVVLDGRPKGAFQAFIEFVRMGGEPDGITLCAFLNACADTLNLVLGKQLHGFVMRSGFETDVYVGSALVDMYGKCGSIHDAEQTFREMPEKNLFAWNAMISGYAHQGHADMAIGLFREMASVVAPNYVTFVCVLSACSRGGAVETGMDVYESMMKKYGIEAGPEHYACVVDMLARSGLVERAYDFVQKLPIRPTISIWGALLNACRVHGKPEIGKIAADNLFELDPKDSGNHVLLSNMFAVAGR